MDSQLLNFIMENHLKLVSSVRLVIQRKHSVNTNIFSGNEIIIIIPPQHLEHFCLDVFALHIFTFFPHVKSTWGRWKKCHSG